MPDNVRPRIGLILPSAQVVTEPMFNETMGHSWDFVTARVLLKGARAADLRKMEEGIPLAVEQLSTARIDALVSCCTASGALNGRERDHALCQEISATIGAPATSTMLSIIARLEHLGARSLTVVTPYVPELAAVEHEYLESNGFTVRSSRDLNVDDAFAMSSDTVDNIVDNALAAWDDQADAMLLSCMNWPTHEAMVRLQSEIGAPVVTSHSATLWNVQQLLGPGGPS